MQLQSFAASVTPSPSSCGCESKMGSILFHCDGPKQRLPRRVLSEMLRTGSLLRLLGRSSSWRTRPTMKTRKTSRCQEMTRCRLKVRSHRRLAQVLEGLGRRSEDRSDLLRLKRRPILFQALSPSLSARPAKTTHRRLQHQCSRLIRFVCSPLCRVSLAYFLFIDIRTHQIPLSQTHQRLPIRRHTFTNDTQNTNWTFQNT